MFIHIQDIRPMDIIRGRGAANVHRWYHQKMLNRKDRLRKKYNYSSLRNHKAKRRIQLKLLQSIHRRGGRVLAKVPNATNMYYELPMKEALVVMSSKLRENRKATTGIDAGSIASDTTTDIFDFHLDMSLFENIMEDDEYRLDDANEGLVIDFNGMIPPP